MKTESYIDKSDWGPGPWSTEPDKLEWRSAGTPRMPCLIVRSEGSGALCGYVGVPPGHPYHGADLDKVGELHVHGGVTYAAPCQDGGKICHVPLPGESADVYWIGFDCAHYLDVMPAHDATVRRVLGRPSSLGLPGVYRDVDWVSAEVESLCGQLQRVAKGLPAEQTGAEATT